MDLLLTTAYFPPVEYFSKIKTSERIFIEQFEHYGKQSYRNRCEILSANGIMSLSVPVKKTTEIKFFTKDARIDYSTRWQKLHFKSIESAYKNSPYYDYYIEDFIPFFEQKEVYLLDLNLHILEVLRDLLQLDAPFSLTSDYISHTEHFRDLRNAIHPKPSRRESRQEVFEAIPYTQTFSDRFPFIPNLSIVDLLFNTGPEAPEYL